jgi:putative restriction endonuclease
MPSVAKKDLIHAIKAAFYASGAELVRQRCDAARKPWSFRVVLGGATYDFAVFIWTLTHGGGRRDSNELRIQMTGATSPLEQRPNQKPLLLGYDPQRRLFAGFEFSKHVVFGASPSIQVLSSELARASLSGLSIAVKGNSESAIGIRPDHLLIYAVRSDELHQMTSSQSVSRLLLEAPDLTRIKTVERIDGADLSEDRRKVLREVMSWSRDSRFRSQVMNTYGGRCSVTKMQLRLVDAAHVLAVSDCRSNDDVTNGILLTPTFHRAYDMNLIYLEYGNQALRMRVNERLVSELVADGLGDNLSLIRDALADPLHLPEDRDKWPSRDMVDFARERIS